MKKKTNRKTIRVTKTDIAKGVRWDPWKCPVALALRRALIKAGREHGYIEASRSRLFAGGKAYTTPKRVSDFMDRFDTRRSVRPFAFTLTYSK